MDWNFDLDDIKPESPNNNDFLPPSDEGEEDKSLGWPYGRIVQANTTLAGYYKGYGAGFVAVGRNVTPEGGGEKRFEGYLFESGKFGFFVIDTLSEGAAGKRQGARSLWPFRQTDGGNAFDPNVAPEDKKPSCRSIDGKAPTAGNIGKIVTLPDNHPHAGGKVVIGLSSIIDANILLKGGTVDVQFPAADAVCDSCPLSKWWRPAGKDKDVRPLCSQKFDFVFYVPPQMAYVPNEAARQGKKMKNMEETMWPGGYVVFQSGSPTVHAAMTSGDGRRQPMLTKGGEQVFGLYHFMSRNSEDRRILMPKTDMHKSLMKSVKGFSPTENLEDVVETVIPAELTAMANSEDYPYVYVSVPTYKYAANGLPQHVGIATALPGMRYLNMNVVESAWQNNPLMPQLFIDEAVVTVEDLEAWLEAGQGYQDIGARDVLMYVQNHEAVVEKLALASGQGWQALVASRDQAALPATAGGNGGEVVEGEVIDDMS